MDFHPVQLVEKHPILTGAVVFVGGLALLTMFGLLGGSKGSSSGAGNSGEVSDYFGAETANAQAGDAVQIAAIQAQAGTAQTSLNDTAAVTINGVNTAASTEINDSNNATAISLAPFGVEAAIASALEAIGVAGAENPLSSTSTSTNNGFFGIGGGTSTTHTISPNPAAGEAGETLQQILNGFTAGH
jgi:hypothetical protein